MKRCQACHAPAAQKAKTCSVCGQASWTAATEAVPRAKKSEETIKEMAPPASTEPPADTHPSPDTGEEN